MGLCKIIDFRYGEATVSQQGNHSIMILSKKYIKQRLKEQMCFTAAVFCPLAEPCFEEITC